MSRRILSLALALCLTLCLGGCGHRASEPALAGDASFGAGNEPSSAEPEQETASGDVATSFSMPCNASFGWDVYTCVGMENRAVMNLVYEGLFTLNNRFEAEPLLCKSYTLSETGYVYTLELQSATFSNGKELTADDVVYSMGKAAASPLYKGRFDDIGGYYASGSSTVTIEMYRPNDRLPCLLDFPIIPAYAGTDSPVGTGPFARSGDILTVNPTWWQGSDKLQFRTVNLYTSVSAEDTRDNFEIDNIHFVYNNPNASTAVEYHSDYELWNSRATTMQYIGFNFVEGIFQDDAVRAAVTHAINRSSIAESVYHNFADAAALPVHPASSLYDEALAQKFAYTSSRSAMEELMATASFYLPKGYDPTNRTPGITNDPGDQEDEEAEDPYGEVVPDGEAAEDAEEEAEEKDDGVSYNRITMLVRSGNYRRVAAAKLAAQSLSDAGFTVTLRELENDEFYYTLNAGEWDLYYGEVTLQPDFDLRPLLMSGGSLSYGGFTSPDELNDLLTKSMENSGNCYDLYKYIMEQGFLCPVLFINNAVYTTRGVFSGLDPAPENLFYHIADVQLRRE